jgi:hypothetical protein
MPSPEYSEAMRNFFSPPRAGGIPTAASRCAPGFQGRSVQRAQRFSAPRYGRSPRGPAAVVVADRLEPAGIGHPPIGPAEVHDKPDELAFPFDADLAARAVGFVILDHCPSCKRRASVRPSPNPKMFRGSPYSQAPCLSALLRARGYTGGFEEAPRRPRQPRWRRLERRRLFYVEGETTRSTALALSPRCERSLQPRPHRRGFSWSSCQAAERSSNSLPICH